MKATGISLSVAGALTLAVQLFQVHFLAGTEIARYRVMSGPGAWAEPGDGFVGTAEPEAAHHAGPFTLDPSMNPVRAVLEVRRDGTAAASYRARLLDERGATVWTGSGVHRVGGEGSGPTGSSLSVSLEPFEVEGAGRYVLLLQPEEGGAATLRSGANVILRGNVGQTHPALVAAGLLALVAGVALLVLPAARGRRRPAAEQPAAE